MSGADHHTIVEVRLAQRLHNDEGLGATAIQRRLAATGIYVAHSTLRRWLDPGVAEADRKVARHRYATSHGYDPDDARIQGHRSEAWKVARIKLLHSQGGMTLRAIAACMAADFPDDPHLTKGQVRHILLRGAWPRPRRPAAEAPGAPDSRPGAGAPGKPSTNGHTLRTPQNENPEQETRP